MGIFDKYTASVQTATESLVADAAVVPVIDDKPVTDPKDPLDVGTDKTAQHAEQRAALNADIGMESLENKGEPVDGTNEDMTIDSTDTDVELPEGEFEANMSADAELDQIEQEASEVEALEGELNMLADSFMAVESFGMNPTALGILQATGLMNGTAMESLGLESIGFTNAQHDESKLALESLGGKIKDKAAAMSAKVLSVVKNSGAKVLSVVEPIFTKITETAKKIMSGAWDAAKAGGAKVKAHPMATVLAVIAAIGAVGGILILTGTATPAPGGKIEGALAFLRKLATDINKIKWLGGKSLNASVNDKTLRLTFDGATGAKEFIGTMEPLEKLGWTQQAVKTALSQLDRAWKMFHDGWTALGTRGTKLASSVAEVGGGVIATVANGGTTAMGVGYAAGGLGAAKLGAGVSGARAVGGATGIIAGVAYFSFVAALFGALFKLARKVVVSGFRLVAGTFRAIAGAVTG